MAVAPEPASPPADASLYLSLPAAADLPGVTLAELEIVRVGTQMLVRRASLGRCLAPAAGHCLTCCSGA